ncbi:MAG: outer membrane protein assembly factor BamA [Acidobacteriota bacterium]|jgi:outer membrane protein insertion porin family
MLRGIIAAAVVLAVGIAAAQERAPIISEVVVEGGTTITADTVEYYLGISAGDPFDAEAIAKSFRRFWDSGLVEDLLIEKEEIEPGKVRVIVRLRERPIVKEWKFEGNKKLSTTTLREKLDAAGVTLRRNVPLRISELNRARQALAEAYAADGYASAVIVPEISDEAGHLRTVTFRIDEGGKVRIGRISFDGNERFSDWRLRRALKKTKQKSLLRPFGKKLIWSRENWGEDSENLKKFYLNRGYKDIVVGEPRTELVARRPEAETQKKKKFATLVTIPVQEGRQFRMGQLSLSGATVFENDQLLSLYETRPGKVYNHSRIEAGNEAVRTLYNSRGYIYAYTNQVLQNGAEPDVVDVTVKIYEGDRYRLGRLEFTGNTKTQEKVLRREFRLFEGDWMDMTAFRRSVFKVNQLGYFKLAEDPLEFKFDEQAKLVNVTIKGQEVGRTDIQFGAGYSELDHFFFQFMFNTRNFMGRGETLGVSLSSGRRADSYSITFSEPYFLDRRMVIGGSIFKQKLDLTTYLQDRKGLTALWGVSVGDFSQVTFLYAYDDTVAKEVVARLITPDFPNPPPRRRPLPPPYKDMPFAETYFATFAGVTSSVTPAFFIDSRDDPFDPNQGLSLSTRLKVAGGILGGEFDYVRPEAAVAYFYPLRRRYVLAANLEGGRAIPFGGGALPYWERYRIGGERSLRGFPVYRVFPRDKSTGEPYLAENGAPEGGDRYLQLNLEYQIRLGGPLKFILFTDIGNNWHERQGWELSNYRHSAGAELRIFLPIFQAPLRFIYSKPIKKFKDDPFESFTFSIGTTF